MKHRKWISLLIAFLVTGTLYAQPRGVDRANENSEFVDLQVTELQQERNITDAYTRLGELGWLVKMAMDDRKLKQEEEATRGLDFKKTFRYIQYTPRNTYVRFIKEDKDFILNSFGQPDDVLKIVNERVKLATALDVAAKEISFPAAGAGREGIELTQFDFVYSNDPDKRRAIGSRRKSLMLFFTKKGDNPNDIKSWELSLVVTKIINDDFRKGVRDVEMIIDTNPLNTPTAEKETAMDDVVILHRYNHKPTRAIVVGAMSNTSTNPHRVEFKQKFYSKVLDHFFRLYRMVANYASKDSNDFNEDVLQLLDKELEY